MGAATVAQRKRRLERVCVARWVKLQPKLTGMLIYFSGTCSGKEEAAAYGGSNRISIMKRIDCKFVLLHVINDRLQGVKSLL
jgi:hypothetical protein